MKTIITFLALLISISSTFAQNPMAFKYQGTARNNDGVPYSNTALGLRIKITQGSATGTIVYMESHLVNSSDIGHFSANVGEGSILSGTFTDIEWGTDVFFMEVAMDANGGTDYQVLGTNRLLSVPYAMYAAKSGGGGGTPDHEWDGSMLRFQNPDGSWGDFVNLLGPTGEKGEQGIPGMQGAKGEKGDAGPQGEQGPAGSAGNYTGGSGIDITGDVISNIGDNDNDSTNELQNLSYDYQTNFLHLSPGDSVQLPFDTCWTKTITLAIPPTLVGISANAPLNADDFTSINSKTNSLNADQQILVGPIPGSGSLESQLHLESNSVHFDGTNSDDWVFIAPEKISWLNGLRLEKHQLLFDPDPTTGATMPHLNLTREGLRIMNQATDWQTVELTGGDHGSLILNNENGSRYLWATKNSVDAGFLQLSGPMSSTNFVVNSISGFPDRGYVGISDENSAAQVELFVNASGKGVVSAHSHETKMTSPARSNETIHYASIQGPEVAIYARGTGKLANGNAMIQLPDHFRIAANESSMTVQITPLSHQTYGLAVIDKSNNGFTVKELMDGTGNFEFDWEVKCKQKGFEKFEVVREVEKNDKPAKQ